MSPDELKKLLKQVKEGKVEIDKALDELKELPFKNLGHTMVDSHRELRTGYPEVIFCAGKTIEQVVQIIEYMITRDNNVLGTRATEEMYTAVKKIVPEAVYNKLARTITIKRKEYKVPESYISVVTAGTSDIPVAEEAAITAEIFGNKVERIFDVGVAGIHRLHGNINKISDARIIIVVATTSSRVGRRVCT